MEIRSRNVWQIIIIIIIIIINSIEQGPSLEANRSSASQEIPHILCNVEAHYHIHRCPPPVPVQTQTNPDHAFHPTS